MTRPWLDKATLLPEHDGLDAVAKLELTRAMRTGAALGVSPTP
jgi:hypothetical protein